MVQVITIILGFLYSTLCVFINFLLYKRTKKINLLIIFIFTLGIFNGIIPSFLLNEAIDNNYNFFSNIIIQYTLYDIFLYYIQNIILLISVILGWLLTKKDTSKIIDDKEMCNLINLNCTTIKKISIFMITSSIILYYLYSLAYGGFIGLLNYTSAIRSGIFVVNNKFSFLQKFGGLSIFSTLLFYGLLKEKNYSKKDMIWFIISISFSIYYLYSLGGRVSFIAFFVSLMLASILYKYHNSINIKLVYKIGFISIAVMLGLYYITNIFARGSGNLSIIDFFMHELSFPFASFKMMSSLPGKLMFKHVILAPLYFLPSSIWEYKLGIDTASSFNTFLFMGAYKGENGVTGSIPLDMVSFSWIEGGVLGGVIIGILYGFVVAILQKRINEIPNRGVKSAIFSYVAIKFSIIAINYGDTVHLIQGEFSFIVGFVFLIYFLKRNIKRTKISKRKGLQYIAEKHVK